MTVDPSITLSRAPAREASVLRRRKASRAEGRAGVLFAVPWMVALPIFTLIPLVLTFVLGFTRVQIAGIAGAGAENFEAMLADSAFWTSARNSLVFALVSVPIKLVLALCLALLLNR